MKPLGLLAMVAVPFAFTAGLGLVVLGKLGAVLFDWSLFMSERWRNKR
jgi:hypothetical protein